MDTVERKFQIVIKEWEHVEILIARQAESKFKIKSWAITVFSGIFALAIHQNNNESLLLSIATTSLFWMFDSIHHGAQKIFFLREHKIEEFLENPTDEDILEFKSPLLGRQFKDKDLTKSSMKGALISREKFLFYGSMILFVIIAYILF